MEIVRLRGRACRRRRHPPRLHRNHAVLILQHAVDQ